MTKMKSIFLCVFGFSLFVYGSAERHEGEDYENSDDVDEPKPSLKIVTEFEKDTSQVAATLYQGVKKTEPELKNFVMSPLGLTTVMVMLNEGSRGETAREIQTLFEFGTNSSFTLRNHTQVLNSLQNQTGAKNSGVELLTASRIFANSQNANLLEDYKTAVSLLGKVETFSFADPKHIVEKTNEWVKNRTRGKISKLVEEKDFSGETAAVLLNAVYFKAPWKHPFNSSLTKKQDFHVSGNETVQVDMMNILAEFPYADLSEDEAVTAVFLPYKGDRLSMIIYLPWERSNLSSLEKNLNYVPSEIYNRAEPREISLYLPKFNISSALDLKPVLNHLGLQKMFNGTTADFSKMSSAQEFHVSKVRQQVFIEVNEVGTEAAVATGATGVGPVSTTTVLRIDHPFFFQIYDNVTNVILFSGRVQTPLPLKSGNNVTETTTTEKTETTESSGGTPTNSPPKTNTTKTPTTTTTYKPVDSTEKSGQAKNNFMAPLFIFCLILLGI